MAHVKWGREWRMPTADVFAVLMDNCTWKWGTLNGDLGHKNTSKINGKSIFLPEGDFYMGDALYNTSMSNEAKGYYWSSSLDEENPTFAKYFCFGVDFSMLITRDRYYGRPVRAVCP